MPAVTRKGDADLVHCSVPYRDEASPDVTANGIRVSRQGDHNTPHVLPGSPCPGHYQRQPNGNGQRPGDWSCR